MTTLPSKYQDHGIHTWVTGGTSIQILAVWAQSPFPEPLLHAAEGPERRGQSWTQGPKCGSRDPAKPSPLSEATNLVP